MLNNHRFSPPFVSHDKRSLDLIFKRILFFQKKRAEKRQTQKTNAQKPSLVRANVFLGLFKSNFAKASSIMRYFWTRYGCPMATGIGRQVACRAFRNHLVSIAVFRNRQVTAPRKTAFFSGARYIKYYHWAICVLMRESRLDCRLQFSTVKTPIGRTFFFFFFL